MALMSLKLWELASLALPMVAILAVQALFMALYAMFVTRRMMGKTTMPRCWRRALWVWSGCHANGNRQYAGNHRTFRAFAHGVSGGTDGWGILY